MICSYQVSGHIFHFYNFSRIPSVVLGLFFSFSKFLDVICEYQQLECLLSILDCVFSLPSHHPFCLSSAYFWRYHRSLISASFLICKDGRVGLSDLSFFFLAPNYMVLWFFNGSKIEVQVALPFLCCCYHVKHILPEVTYPFLFLFKVALKIK